MTLSLTDHIQQTCHSSFTSATPQPAYYHQARVEIGVLQLLNGRCDPCGEHRIVRMVDYFLHRKHLCLVFEKLDGNLFELLKRNAFRGLSLQLVQLFLRQILDALEVLHDAAIIHCDLKVSTRKPHKLGVFIDCGNWETGQFSTLS